jgi:3-isopropylmalate dehydrogenase
MLPSASIGARRTAHGVHGLYEPIHGSAPDIAGRDIANPLGTILSAAMLLRWSLGEQSAADAVESGVRSALAEGYRTRDLVTSADAEDAAITVAGTREMASAVIRGLRAAVGTAQPAAGTARAAAGTAEVVAR